MLIQAQEEKDDVDGVSCKEINIDPKTYCKLGHFHLLLEDYSKGKFNIFIMIYKMLISSNNSC